MNGSRARVLAWGLVAFVVLGVGVNLIVQFRSLEGGLTASFWADAGWAVAIPLVFSLLAALIIAKLPGNRVGWLMMVVGLATASPASAIINAWPGPPASVDVGTFLLLWLGGYSWVPFIFPIFLIPLYFPTGSPPTPRWRWVSWLAILVGASLLLVGTFTDPIDAVDAGWTVSNPIGFIPTSFVEGPYLVVFGALVLTSVIGSVASLFVRYRRAKEAEQQQIKWLLFAGAVFLVVYTVAFLLPDSSGAFQSGWINTILFFAILGIPVAIAISIFRYRLWDLDVVVNRALIYGPLTTMLAGVFAMLIAITTEVAKQTLGAQSQTLGAAIGAVTVAVIFQPLRSRIQDFVDKRFYPQKANLTSGLVEVESGYWPFLDQQRLIDLSIEHISSALGTPDSALHLRADAGFRLAGQRGEADSVPDHLVISDDEVKELKRGRVVPADPPGPWAGHIPVFVDRGQSIELLGLLSIGERSNGRGYSGDELRAMVELGGKIGLALNALQLAEPVGVKGASEPVIRPAVA
ncbi:MAG: hypothetical protein WBR18_06180 [Anaerolineales bacterium]